MSDPSSSAGVAARPALARPAWQPIAVICEDCCGRGWIEVETGGPAGTATNTCPHCEGEGVVYLLPKSSLVRALWQPIASAPKDGTKILVFTVHGEMELTEWYELKRAVYEPVGGGLFTMREVVDAEGWNGNEPTHWQALPPPPERD